MLRSSKDLEGYTVTATDGEVGSVVNFLLDDEHWVVRYLVVQTWDLRARHGCSSHPCFFAKPTGQPTASVWR